MSELLGITVEELVATATERRARIPSEIGAFLALETCEALADGPARVRPADVRIADDGTISIFAPPHSASAEEAARAVVAILSGLLVASGTGAPRALTALIEQGPSSGSWDLGSLRDDLEASLVPLNRAAARRVLSRMLRDVRRPRVEPAPPPRVAHDQGTLDAQLDALLDAEAEAQAESAAALDAELDATISELDAPSIGAPAFAEGPGAISALDVGGPAEAGAVPPSRSGARDAIVAGAATPAGRGARDMIAARAATPAGRDTSIASELEPSAALDAPSSRGARSTGRAPVSAAPAYDPDDATLQDAEPPAPRPRAVDPLEGLGELDPPRRRGSPLGWILAFVALLTATVAALALMRPDLVDRALGRPPAPAPDPGPTDADRERMLREHRARFGTLVVTAAPPRAQLLMFVGRGPALATDLPVGVALEFVAVADGRAPTRALVPADATWDEVEGRPRYELAMQTGREPMAELALGPTTLPQDVGAPTGALGDVRVITNPPGAKVYVVVGFAPNVTIENVRTDEAIELLLYAEGSPIRRLVVGPSDWIEAADGAKRAEVSVAIEPAAGD